MWISPTFGIKVSRWINEWRIYSLENENRYQQALSEITPCKKISKEKEINNKLVNTMNGIAEVKTPVGVIDIMTEDKIIEIKEIKNWKHAVGQILSYSVFIDKTKCIYLFNDSNNELDEIIDVNLIHKVCKEFDIEVIFDT